VSEPIDARVLIAVVGLTLVAIGCGILSETRLMSLTFRTHSLVTFAGVGVLSLWHGAWSVFERRRSGNEPR
jgi:hypothetical protein